jgi:hypothetical protein
MRRRVRLVRRCRSAPAWPMPAAVMCGIRIQTVFVSVRGT